MTAPATFSVAMSAGVHLSAAHTPIQEFVMYSAQERRAILRAHRSTRQAQVSESTGRLDFLRVTTEPLQAPESFGHAFDAVLASGGTDTPEYVDVVREILARSTRISEHNASVTENSQRQTKFGERGLLSQGLVEMRASYQLSPCQLRAVEDIMSCRNAGEFMKLAEKAGIHADDLAKAREVMGDESTQYRSNKVVSEAKKLGIKL